MWRHNLRPEANFLGIQYTPAGMDTYAPYKVKKPDHWLFEGTQVEKGDLFGFKGINDYPISGDETDKKSWFSSWDVTVIAKGTNPANSHNDPIYRNSSKIKKGGGAISFREVNDKTGILATGSIQSGSGLGQDSVFSKLIMNFSKKYVK